MSSPSVPAQGKPSTDGRLTNGHASLSTHYVRYSISNGAVMLLGFISFPILTRLLDNAEFGVLKYYDTLMLLGVALVKFGAPHAIVRFYPYDRDPDQMRAFGTNLVFLPLVLSVTLWAIGAIFLVVVQTWLGGDFHPLFWFALMLVPLLATTNIVQMVIRASERSDLLMSNRIIARVLELVFVLCAVILLQQSALAVYGGKILAAALVLAWLGRWMYRNVSISRDAINLKDFKNGLIYGSPLMANELAGGVLANLDRVLIRFITGDFSMVGIYAIGYALAMQLNVFLNATLSEAFTPVVTRTYEQGGGDEVRALKSKVLLPMTYAVGAIVAMLVVSGHDVLIALSGRDKGASGDVFVVVGVTLSLYALFAICNYGLQLKKRTMQVLSITAVAALLNVGLNFLMIPRMGYMGAAWATAISYAALCLAQFLACPKGLAQLPGLKNVLIAAGCGLLLIGVARGVDMFGIQNAWGRLLVAAILFVVLYAIPVLMMDSRMRQMAMKIGRRPL